MKLIKLRGLNEKGFHAHLLVPLLAFIAVGGIGYYLLIGSHAATSCRAQLFSYGAGITTNKGKGVKCVGNVQLILNAAYVSNSGFASYAKSNKYTAPAPAAAPFSGTLAADGKFGPQTLNRVGAFQSYYANSTHYDSKTKKYTFTNLSVDGQVGPNTWTALCAVGMSFSNVSQTQFKNDKNHTGAYWERLAYNAAKTSGCWTTDKEIVSPHGTTHVVASGGSHKTAPPYCTLLTEGALNPEGHAVPKSDIAGAVCGYNGKTYSYVLNAPIPAPGSSGLTAGSTACYNVLLARDQIQGDLTSALGVNASNSINKNYLLPAFHRAYPNCL